MKYEFLKPSQKKKIMDGLKNDLTIKQISEKLEISVGVINEVIEKKFTRK
tara:strand:- start:266 stop:415 length:150 start_codon:yes stop_codon:yes gene_type:complete